MSRYQWHNPWHNEWKVLHNGNRVGTVSEYLLDGGYRATVYWEGRAVRSGNFNTVDEAKGWLARELGE